MRVDGTAMPDRPSGPGEGYNLRTTFRGSGGRGAGIPIQASSGGDARTADVTGEKHQIRTDIQALRAIAVALVLLYHVWPDRLPGGFVGVDVFLVISGFLITSHLLAAPPRGVRDLAGFWARRIVRLLPAALLVLACTLAASRLVAPDTMWRNTANEILAAAFYLSNWLFALRSVSYLAADDAPSPVLHYWSLSVEEQFYFVWPVAIMLLVGAATVLFRRHRARTAALVTTGLAVITGLSFVASVLLTATSPGRAYFITPTRIWELGIGGLLAALLCRRAFGRGGSGAVPLPHGARQLLAVIGLAAIVWSAVAFSATTPFPGWHAAVPVLGAAALIAAASPGALGRALAVRPVQFLGDISYSVYLWHWPLLVLWPYAMGRDLTFFDRVLVIGATLLLATATKRFVEDPLRRPRFRRPLYKPFLAAGLATAALFGLVGVQVREIQHREATALDELRRAVSQSAPCFGPAALADPVCAPSTRGSFVPAPIVAAQDLPDYYDGENGHGCRSESPNFPLLSCTYGSDAPTADIALVGNSHAGQWLPAMQALAEKYNWRITTFLASKCMFAQTDQPFATTAQSSACRRWVGRVTDAVAEGSFDAVVLANLPLQTTAEERPRPGDADWLANRAGYDAVLREWDRAAIRVLGISDTPSPRVTGIRSVPECLAGRRDAFSACAGARAEWIQDDPLVSAIARVGSSRMVSIDLNDHICRADTCDPVVGGVMVYRDGSHLTATYARALASYLVDPLRALMAGSTVDLTKAKSDATR